MIFLSKHNYKVRRYNCSSYYEAKAFAAYFGGRYYSTIGGMWRVEL